MLRFPDGFRWGAATSAYQIEGGATEGGRGRSIWDTFSHTPGKVHAGDTGDVACDHYHRYRADVALMAGLGLDVYRFSIAWPRIQPDGTGPANPAGMDFYDRLVDEVLAHGIEPLPTLYHWDLPQALEDQGGWPVRDTAYRFAEFARLVYARLGDRIPAWVTMNEPWCIAFLGYQLGIHAPGRTEPAAAFAAAHHLLLGHGEAVRALRSAGATDIGINVDPAVGWPADPDSDADNAAARLTDDLHDRLFLEPLSGRGYPPSVLAEMRRHGGLDWLHDGDLEIAAAPIDRLGINYYAPDITTVRDGATAGDLTGADLEPATGDYPVTAMGWPIAPAGLIQALEWIARDYPGVPIWVTENGAAFDDRSGGDGQVSDPDRIRYLDAHLRALHTAISRGVDVRGYIAWSLMDNFEWAEGYAKRFGLFYVDYGTQARIAKDSAHWYAGVIARHGLAEPAPAPDSGT